MNAVEIEEAVTRLAALPFDAEEFPYALLEAYGNKETTIKQLRYGGANKSEVGGVLQRNNIHIKVAEEGKATEILDVLVGDSATKKAKAKFALATDGLEVHAIDLVTGDPHIFDYADFPEYFGEFLPLAGIHVVQHTQESSVDVKATRRLNQIYTELIKQNPEWGTDKLRREMNKFMARLIFCLFAEDTAIFTKENLFTKTIDSMSEKDSANTHEIVSDIFLAMSMRRQDRPTKLKQRPTIDAFPHVNGWLFTDDVNVPRFSRIARAYLLRVGQLDWKEINPDIFGSMIQAITDDEERGSLGAHYTSVPNILKVLNPLFLDDLRDKLEKAGTEGKKLLHLRKRLSGIRVFDPACGSGNFLVIAYKAMREIEAEINMKIGKPNEISVIPLTNFRGIEIGDFSAEIARLALVIAEYQCNVIYRGQMLAMEEFLPLDSSNWIVCGNALRIDWLSVCPPTGREVEHRLDVLEFESSGNAKIAFENEGGEVFICSNPPYLGSRLQSVEQKSDIKHVIRGRIRNWKKLDYVAGWFIKAADYSTVSTSIAAFVSTSSISQGEQVSTLWPLILESGNKILFAHTSFKWSNLASNKAMVSVVIVGISTKNDNSRSIYSPEVDGKGHIQHCENINPYLISAPNTIVYATHKPICDLPEMCFGNQPIDDGNLSLSRDEVQILEDRYPDIGVFIKRFLGAKEIIHGIERYCLWIEDHQVNEAMQYTAISERLKRVTSARSRSRRPATRNFADKPHRFVAIQGVANDHTIVVPGVSSESREYLPVDLLDAGTIISNSCFGLYDTPLRNMAIIASKLHGVWIRAVGGKLEDRLRYSNTLGWNTFPVPRFTEKNEQDLKRCAEDILIAREWHFPATIAELYAPGAMPANLREAHDQNDEVVERIFIGRRFKNDTERLEVLFDRYASLTGGKRTW